MEASMPDDEPPTPPPPLPPPFAPPEADVSTVNRIAQYMAQAKKATKRVQLTPDEAMDRMLADHERRAAKKKKQLSPDEMLDMLLAEHDRKAAKKKKATPVEALADIGQHEKKKAQREVGPGTVLALEDKKEERSVVALVSKKAKIVPTQPVKKAKLSKSKKSTAEMSGSQRRKQYAT
jgi:hypothetical protein